MKFSHTARITLLLGVLVVLPLITLAAKTEADYCITSCKRRTSGNYQSCLGCNIYVSCNWGKLKDNMPCPDASTEWDDYIKGCVNKGTSQTCGEGLTGEEYVAPTTTKRPTTTTTPTTIANCLPEVTESPLRNIRTPTEGSGTTNPGQCVTSCQGMRNGDYQSCVSCDVYASCYKGELYDERPCSTAASLFWNDFLKLCVWPGQENSCDAPSDGFPRRPGFSGNEPTTKAPQTKGVSRWQPVCMLVRTEVRSVTVEDDCLAPTILQTRCEGVCHSHQVYNGVDQMAENGCSFCKATKIQTLTVQVSCPDGSSRPYTYPAAEECECGECQDVIKVIDL